MYVSRLEETNNKYVFTNKLIFFFYFWRPFCLSSTEYLLLRFIEEVYFYIIRCEN